MTDAATATTDTDQDGEGDASEEPLHHPALRTPEQLTFGERMADKLRNGMGSWGFVIAALVFLAGWMIGNRNVGFDRYPFILLNLILSCLAAMQGAILLIAAKREDQISSDLANHDYQTNVEADRIVKEIHELTKAIHERTKDIHATVCATPGSATAPQSGQATK
ncbi:MAG: hypothetical protein JWM34_688 [Ilumatobacteraceae bacterium]|nr:hypothetical protein [Ilumatobacteraceae bacterium]